MNLSVDKLRRLRGRPSEENDADIEEESSAKLNDSHKSTSLSFAKVIPRLNLTSDYDSSNSGSELTIDEGIFVKANIEHGNFKCHSKRETYFYAANPHDPESKNWIKCALCGAYLSNTCNTSPDSCDPRHKKVNLKWPFVDLPPPLTPRLNPKGHYIIDSVCYDLEEISNSSLLSLIDQWDYPIFELYDQVGDTILSQMSYYVFAETGIIEAFRVPMTEFLLYFRALECGYRHKPCMFREFLINFATLIESHTLDSTLVMIET